jgi:hypothetical protein
LKNRVSGAVRRLDKRLFEAGQQCLKRLYLDYNEPVRGAPGEDSLSENRRALSAIGQQLLQLARGAFPRGVEAGSGNIEQIAARTRELLAADGTAVVFGGAFVTDELEAQTDILLRQKDGSLDVFEVKSGTKVNARYIADLALQVLAIENSGFTVRAAHVLHVNHNYAHKEGEPYPVQQLFKNADVTERVRRALPRVVEQVRSFRQQVRDESALHLPTGTFCTNPFPCPHLEECARKEPALPLRKLSDLTPSIEASLHEEGIDDLAALDAQRPGLTFRQRQTLRAVQENRLVVEPFVREELRHVEYPLHCIASAGVTDALPRFNDQRPWRQLVYAWAVETVHEDGRVQKQAFVFADKGDPRGEVIRSLAECLSGGGMLLCWCSSALEGVRSLLDDLPAEKGPVRTILSLPHLDMLKLFESGVFHPRLLGSNNLIDTAAVLLGEQVPADLEIRSSEAVFAALQKAWTPRVRAATKEKIASELRRWVEWQASMVAALHRRFSELAPRPATAPQGPARLVAPRKPLPPPG